MDKFAAITFDDKELKFVSISSKGATFQVDRVEKTDLAAGLVSDFEICDQKAFVSALRRFLFDATPKIEVGALVLGVPANKSFLKVVTLKDEIGDVSEAIVHKAVSNFPLTEENGYFSWQKKDGEIQIAACQKNLIDNWLYIFKSAALKVLAIKPAPLALVNLLDPLAKVNLIVLANQDGYQLVIGKKGLVYQVESGQFSEEFVKSTELLAEKINTLAADFVKSNPALGVEKIFISTPDNTKLTKVLAKNNLTVENLPLPMGLTKEQEDYIIPAALAITESGDTKEGGINFPPQEQPMVVPAESQESQPSSSFPLKGVIAALALIIIIAVLAFRFFGWGLPFFGKGQKEETGPTITIESPTQEATQSAAATESAKATQSAVVAKKEDFTIEILNGSGVQGVAAKTQTALRGKGWKVEKIGNADREDYATTQLRFKKSFEPLKNDLISDLKGSYQVEVGDNLADTEEFDVEIILGLK